MGHGCNLSTELDGTACDSVRLNVQQKGQAYWTDNHSKASTVILWVWKTCQHTGAGDKILEEIKEGRMLGAMGRGGGFILEQTNFRQRGTGGRRNNTSGTLRTTHSKWGVWTFNSADTATVMKKLKGSKSAATGKHVPWKTKAVRFSVNTETAASDRYQSSHWMINNV